MPDEPIRVQVAGEDEAHRLLMEHLSDAILREGMYVGQEEVTPLRTFLGDPEGSRRFFPVPDATERLRKMLGRPPGRFYRSRRLGAEPEGAATVLLDAVACVEAGADPPDAMILLTDEDGNPDQIQSVKRVNDHLREREPGRVRQILVGVCVPTAEGWLIPLIAPSRPGRLNRIEKELTFSPVQNPERLCSKPKDKPHHAKRVLHAILAHDAAPLDTHPSHTPNASDTDPALQATDPDLTRLRRLTGCQLAGFLSLLEGRYLPLFTSACPPAPPAPPRSA